MGVLSLFDNSNQRDQVSAWSETISGASVTIVDVARRWGWRNGKDIISLKNWTLWANRLVTHWYKSF